MTTLRIASRGSQLALWQARHVKARLEALRPGLSVEIRVLRTTGDRITDVPLARIGDKGLFTKEVDRSVLDREADAAVHSLKDLPTVPEAGLAIGAILEREDPRDAIVVAPGRHGSLDGLPPGARVGTSSLRRRAQLSRRRPDLVVDDLRGNLDTRLERVAAGDYDAIVLALAGLRRLGREDRVAQRLDPPGWLPAAGQGALAIAIREDDVATAELVGALDHPATRAATTAERTLLRELEGGCQVPIGALATVAGAGLQLEAFVAGLDGEDFLQGGESGPVADAVAIGRRLAARLRAAGADAILDAIRGGTEPPRASAP